MIITGRGKFIGITSLLTALPTLVFANAGSPMMWFGILHSLILNSIIGWTESRVVSNYDISNRTWLIIIGNYVSMFAGFYFFAPPFSTIAGNSDFWGRKTSFGDYELQGFFTGMGADESKDSAFCLIEAPNEDAVRILHDNAHGLITHHKLMASLLTN